MEFLKTNFKLDQVVSENAADFNILEKQIQQYIGELPHRRQEIYRLSREKGISNKEIAESLKISIKTVESNLDLAIKFLKSRLSDGSLPSILFIALFC